MDWAMSHTDNPDEAICCLVSKLLPPKGSSVLPPLRTCDEQAAEMLVGIVLTQKKMTANWLKPENAFRRLLKAIKPKCKKGLGMSYKLQIALALDWLSIHVPGQSVSGSGIDKVSSGRKEIEEICGVRALAERQANSLDQHSQRSVADLWC